MIDEPIDAFVLPLAFCNGVCEVVAVDGDGASGAEDAVGLSVEGADIVEPVDGLAGGQEVDAAVGKVQFAVAADAE